MKVTKIGCQINLNQVMDVCFDVSKEKLNSFFEMGNSEYDDEISNNTATIGKKLKQYHEMALKHGKNTLRVICEPTGQYDRKLLRTARRLGFLTAYVNAESVAKFRIVETNDNGKTDIKDPHIMRTLGKLGKTLKHRVLDDNYLSLRKLGQIYDDEEIAVVRIKGQLHNILLELFCDYSKKKDFLYSRSGIALTGKYKCNPYRIVRSGFNRFFNVMRKASKGIRSSTIEELWRDAQSSVLNEIPLKYIKILETEIAVTWKEYLRHQRRKDIIGEEMVAVLNNIREYEPNIPHSARGVITEKHIARLLGETGPLGDFDHWRKLLRYAGLNIRMRQSGKYVGQYKISKKGRNTLRKLLGQVVLPLVKRGNLYGTFYHKKKEKMQYGNKVMTAVMRSFLRKFFGWYKNGGGEFKRDRFFTSYSLYRKLQEKAA